MMRRLRNVFLAGWWLLLSAQVVYAATITLDGLFNDWVGQPSIGDPQWDTSAWWYADLRNWYWTTDGSNAYFMAERWPPFFATWAVDYFLQIDTNNNGAYNDPGDRWLLIHYQPRQQTSEVTVDLYTVDNTGLGVYQKTLANQQNWGDSDATGGTRAEWMVSFADLGITGTTAINMVLSTVDILWNGNMGYIQTLDSSAEVQWTPVDALGWPLLLLVALGGSWLVWRTSSRTVESP